MGADSLWHWVIVVVVVLLLFGRGKVSELMGDVAHGIKGFKRAMSDEGETGSPPPPTSSERDSEGTMPTGKSNAPSGK